MSKSLLNPFSRTHCSKKRISPVQRNCSRVAGLQPCRVKCECNMLPNVFIGKAKKPSDGELAGELGPAKTIWDQLVRELAEEHGIDVHEWNSYSRKAGWSLRLKREERNIVYLSPHLRCFTASFALGDKAVQAASRSGLPAHVLKIIREAKRYAEGTAVRIEVKTSKDVAVVKKLAAVKLEN